MQRLLQEIQRKVRTAAQDLNEAEEGVGSRILAVDEQGALGEIAHPLKIVDISEIEPGTPEIPPGEFVEHGAGIGVFVKSLLEQLQRRIHVFLGAALHVPAAAAHQLPGFQPFPRNLEGAHLLDAIHLAFERGDDLAAEIVLQLDHMLQVALEAAGPDDPPVAAVDQGGVEANAAIRTGDRPGHQIARAEQLADGRHAQPLVAELEARIARDDGRDRVAARPWMMSSTMPSAR